MSRPELDEYLLLMAGLVSTRSSWPGQKVGCVLARDGMVVSTGYNGTPRGYKNVLQKTKANKRYYCHAEENAVVQAARMGARTEGCTAYVNVSPCLPCARMLVNAGVAKLFYGAEWDDPEGRAALDLLNGLGLQTVLFWNK